MGSSGWSLPLWSMVVTASAGLCCWIVQPRSIASKTASPGCSSTTPGANARWAAPGISSGCCCANFPPFGRKKQAQDSFIG